MVEAAQWLSTQEEVQYVEHRLSMKRRNKWARGILSFFKSCDDRLLINLNSFDQMVFD